jgi:hypothetical protein
MEDTPMTLKNQIQNIIESVAKGWRPFLRNKSIYDSHTGSGHWHQ